MKRRALIHIFGLGIFCLINAGTTGCARYVLTASLDFVELGPEGILRHAAERAGSVAGLLATGTLQVRMERGALSAQCAILYAEPDSIRLEISAALGTTILRAMMAGPRIQVYVPSERAVVEGSVEPGDILEFGGIPIELASIRELVLGPAVARNWVDLAAVVDQMDVKPDEIVLGAPRPGGTRLLMNLDTDLHYRKMTIIDADGTVVQESIFEDYRRVGGTFLPRVVRMRYPGRFLQVTFEAARQRVDPARTRGDFMLRLPAGVRRLTLVPPSTDAPAP